MDEDAMEGAIRQILHILHGPEWKEDLHLKETPKRVAKAYAEIFQGYDQDPVECFKVFQESDYKDMLIVGPIKVYSTCAHHMLPFSCQIYAGYIPNGRIAGISKFVRAARAIAQRLQVQERITIELADAIRTALHTEDVMVLIKDSEHMCMKMRGVKDACANVTTSAVRGAFKNHETRAEFLELIK